MDTPEITPEDALKARGIDAATGFATDGQWPVNGRLRAEAMAAAGETTDPAGIVSDELIAATKDRLEREAAETERQRIAEEKAAKPSTRWTVERLTNEAARLNVPVTEGMDKAAMVAAIEAAQTAQKEA